MLTTMRCRRRPADGFTLIELILSIAILGIVLTALAGLMMTSLRVQNESKDRLDETRDEQVLATVLSDDMQGATEVATAVQASCAPGTTAFLEFRGRSFDASGNDTLTFVSYFFGTTTSRGRSTGVITRVTCSVTEADSATLVPPYGSTVQQVVARQLAAAAPAVTCVGGCGKAATSVSVSLTRLSSGDPFLLTGTRRTTL